MVKIEQIETPEFLEIKHVSQGNELKKLSQVKLVELLTTYQAATLAYYNHVSKYSSLKEDYAYVEEGDYEAGSDQQRQKWRQAGRQKALWDRLSLCNGEVLRRIYAGRLIAVEMLRAMQEHVNETMLSDGAMIPTDDEISKEREEAENFPREHVS